jgi:hypothetical protein
LAEYEWKVELRKLRVHLDKQELSAQAHALKMRLALLAMPVLAVFLAKRAW